jgi:hypothetical protein
MTATICVIPSVAYGAASNLDDLLYLRQVDVAVTQADVRLFSAIRPAKAAAEGKWRSHQPVVR